MLFFVNTRTDLRYLMQVFLMLTEDVKPLSSLLMDLWFIVIINWLIHLLLLSGYTVWA